MADIAGETLRDVRLLSRQLRPSILDDLGLHAALERYAEEFETLYPSLDVDLQCDLSERLPGVVEISLYRIIQEAMTNAARHSHATTLGVLIRKRDRGIQAIIEDNGHGFDPQMAQQRGSVGIHAMIERAELLGGRLDIESSDAGSTIFAEIPA
jgi:signal transduction histidine kinase